MGRQKVTLTGRREVPCVVTDATIALGLSHNRNNVGWPQRTAVDQGLHAAQVPGAAVRNPKDVYMLNHDGVYAGLLYSRLTCAAATRQPSGVRTQVWLWRPVLSLPSR
jgi:hypothetical protein